MDKTGHLNPQALRARQRPHGDARPCALCQRQLLSFGALLENGMFTAVPDAADTGI